MRKGQSVSVVRFKEPIHLGKALDPKTYLEKGSKVLNIPTECTFYDETFMQIDFKGTTKDTKYSQLIPWASISTVIFDPER